MDVNEAAELALRYCVRAYAATTCYAMSGTELAYAATRTSQLAAKIPRWAPLSAYAPSCTDRA
eukprot:179959-Rhodomonas_salina.1